MSSTDYVLRVLYGRLSRAFYAFVEQVSAGGGAGGEAPNFDTVADLLAAVPTTITTLASCSNYTGTDGNRSIWFKSAEALADNGTDIRESTHTAGVFYERVWVRESV